jgi:hypothetical protein
VAYTQYSLDSFASQIGILLDDQNELYWTRQEKYLAIWEAMRVWGAYTSYWRNRGAFVTQYTWESLPIPWGSAAFNWNTIPVWYDLAGFLPALRTRTWTLNQIVTDIQYMCLEAANGISGTGMSGQISIQSILQDTFASQRFWQCFPREHTASNVRVDVPSISKRKSEMLGKFLVRSSKSESVMPYTSG